MTNLPLNQFELDGKIVIEDKNINISARGCDVPGAERKYVKYLGQIRDRLYELSLNRELDRKEKIQLSYVTGKIKLFSSKKGI